MQVESDTIENEESYIAFLAKQLRIIHEYRKKNMSKTPRFFESSRKANEENSSGKKPRIKSPIQCHVYLDFEHVRREFPTYLESKELKEFKGKAIDATLGDKSQSEYEGEGGWYMAFITAIVERVHQPLNNVQCVVTPGVLPF